MVNWILVLITLQLWHFDSDFAAVWLETLQFSMFTDLFFHSEDSP